MESFLPSIAGILTAYLALVVVITAVAAEFHERSHWIVARTRTEAVGIDRWRGVFPTSVVYYDPFALPSSVLRLSAVAPALFGLPVGFAVFSLVDASLPVRVLSALPFWTATLLSPSDLLAVFCPGRFQDFAAEDGLPGHLEMIGLLVEELR